MSEGTYQPDNVFDAANTASSPADQQNVATSNSSGYMLSADDLRLIELLRSGNEAAFVLLVEQYNSSLLRLAKAFIPVSAVAEEIVQETWMGVLSGLKRFEGRSSLKTWIFRILTNCAKTRAQREGRSVPFSSLPEFDSNANEPAVDPDRFRPADQQWAGQWVSFPRSWDEIPEERILSGETRACIEGAIEALPPNQREVITLRDIEGWTAEETCSFLGVSEANQRVLLHRARSKVRRALEQYFEEE
jgi:RNA polymerase sigma-70 factor (ECF subfamily)